MAVQSSAALLGWIFDSKQQLCSRVALQEHRGLATEAEAVLGA